MTPNAAQRRPLALAAGLACGLTLAGLLALGAAAQAQGGFATGYVADPFATDALNGGSVTGGLNASPFLDRANAVAGNGNPFAPAGDPFAAGAAVDPFGAPAGGAFPGAAGGFNGEGGGFPGAAGGFPGAAGGFNGGPGGFPGAQGGFGPGGGPAFAPPPPTVTAIYGQRITCVVTGKLIADASVVRVLQSEAAANYADDGKTNKDSVANDNIFTNVTDNKTEFISPEAHLLKSRVISALRYAADRRPNEFFLTVDVASTDPLADDRVPQLLDLETERDSYLTAWSDRFLSGYRKDGEAGGWEFYPTYLPPPPTPPTTQEGVPIDIPAGFVPPDEKFKQNTNAAPGGALGGPAFGGAGALGGGGKAGGGEI